MRDESKQSNQALGIVFTGFAFKLSFPCLAAIGEIDAEKFKIKTNCEKNAVLLRTYRGQCPSGLV